MESVSNICEAVITYYLLSFYEWNYIIQDNAGFLFSNQDSVFQVQEIGDTTLTLTTPSDLDDPNLPPPAALKIAARLNLIENAINDLRTPNCN